MKKLLGMALVAISIGLFSFQVAISIEDVISAMRVGNASKLSEYFDARVDVSLPGRSDNYSKSQAEMILKDFFHSNKVRSFDVKHRGENKDGSLFCVGTLETSIGAYRAKFFMKNKAGDQVLQEIGFELMQ
jgi:hypothetical protein